MEQRLNVLTLGVDDVERARSFYEALGWKIGFTADPDGHTWEVAWIEALRRNPDGTVELPS
jgi:predicted lactoylglutathione lyase